MFDVDRSSSTVVTLRLQAERAFASVRKGRAEALVVGSGQFLFTHQRRVVEFAVENRLPSIYAWKDPVSTGGFIAYGVNIPPGVSTSRLLRR